MKSGPWGLIGVLLTLLLGAGLGLGYAWVVAPRPITDAGPDALRAEFKEQYRALVAASYAATGNLPRAQARLSLLKDADSVEALNAQAQRMLASPQTFERAEQVAALASALQGAADGLPVSVSTPLMEMAEDAGSTFTPTSVLPEETEPSNLLSETPEGIDTQTLTVETQPSIVEATPRPTQTFTPEPGRPFALSGQETVCDATLPDALLQVVVMNRNRRQLPGVEIIITWDGGREAFFTGFKPEIGSGYADYLMNPDTTYTVQLARGSDVALGILAPTCQSPEGQTFLGSIKLTFQQP
jgi:hypothetical protein